jgi:hypothetical protein
VKSYPNITSIKAQLIRFKASLLACPVLTCTYRRQHSPSTTEWLSFAVPLGNTTCCWHFGRAIAQAGRRWLPTAAVRGSKPDLGMWDLWWDKVALGRFSPSSSVSPAVVVRCTNYSTITLMYHPGKMYNRPMCGRSTGAYTNLGDLQRNLMGVKSHPTK